MANTITARWTFRSAEELGKLHGIPKVDDVVTITGTSDFIIMPYSEPVKIKNPNLQKTIFINI